MYERDLLVTTLPCEDDEEDCLDVEHKHGLWDSRTRMDTKLGAGVAYLPHSCDEWVVGGAEEVRSLIGDLEELLRTGGLIKTAR